MLVPLQLLLQKPLLIRYFIKGGDGQVRKMRRWGLCCVALRNEVRSGKGRGVGAYWCWVRWVGPRTFSGLVKLLCDALFGAIAVVIIKRVRMVLNDVLEPQTFLSILT